MGTFIPLSFAVHDILVFSVVEGIDKDGEDAAERYSLAATSSYRHSVYSKC